MIKETVIKLFDYSLLGEIKMKYGILMIIIILVAANAELVSNDYAMMRKDNNTYSTTDGGKTWNQIMKLDQNQFATLEKNGTKYTTDGGRTWQNANAQRRSAEMELKVFSLYPNPLNCDILNVSLTNDLTNKYYEIFIYDLFGRCLMNTNSMAVTKSFNGFNLDLKDMTNGSYIFKLKTNDDIYFNTFLINR
jgi:hypothetical protein